MISLLQRFGPLVLAMLVPVASAWAQAKPAEADALALEADAEPEAAKPVGKAAASDGSLWVEVAAARVGQRYGLAADTSFRLSIDGRRVLPLAPSWRGVLSARLDATDPEDRSIGHAVFSLREAYVGWQGDDGWGVDAGRLTLRDGPAYGYNPTDIFRSDALRTITTANPFSLRENRLGSVMLRVQRLGSGQAWSLALSPKLRDPGRSSVSWSADLGATNGRDRALLSYARRFGEAVNGQLLLSKAAGDDPSVGANGTWLVSDALVMHGELTHGGERPLLAKALGLPQAPERRNRVAAGLTYTTPTRASLTAELHYNGFALERSGWRALQASGLAASAAYHLRALDLQDSASRQALMVYATQPDLAGIKNLELTLLGKRNGSDRSRLLWASLKYRMDRVDVALQLQDTRGADLAEFAIDPVRRAVGVVLTVYP